MTVTASPPPATVLVCTRGRGELVTACVEAIVASLRSSDELLVIEAQSSAAREAVVQLRDDRCRWIAAPHPGKSRQLNIGIRAARNPVVMITDDDCLVATEWIAAMAQPFFERDVGIVFGAVEGLSRLPGSAPQSATPGPAPPEMWRFSHGAAMAVRRTAAFEVGGFDERLGPGTPQHGEEADLLLRMQSGGWRCFAADAPAVQHLEWRSEAEELDNLLVYEGGGGAWVGAALRRGRADAAGAIRTRLRYQFALLRRRDAFALRAQRAFCIGVLAGLRLKPTRFLEPVAQLGPPSSPRRPRLRAEDPGAPAGLPWPSVHGRRCLLLGPRDGAIEQELRRREAAEVVVSELPAAAADLAELGSFDLVVAHGLLRTDEPLRWFHGIHSICSSYLLSIERIHLWRTLVGRHRPHVRRNGRGRARSWTMNGAAHRQILDRAGFEVQLTSRPWFEPDWGRSPGYLKRAVLTRPAPAGVGDRASLAASDGAGPGAAA